LYTYGILIKDVQRYESKITCEQLHCTCISLYLYCNKMGLFNLFLFCFDNVLLVQFTQVMHKYNEYVLGMCQLTII